MKKYNMYQNTPNCCYRLSTVVNCDKILVMDKGRVAEAGRHEDLVSDEDSIYFRLWRSQVILIL